MEEIMTDNALTRIYPIVGQLRADRDPASLGAPRAARLPAHLAPDSRWSAQPAPMPAPHYAQMGVDPPTRLSALEQIGWALLFALAAFLAVSVAAVSGVVVVLFQFAVAAGAPWAPVALVIGALLGFYSLCVAVGALLSAATRPYDGVGGFELAVVFSPLPLGLAAAMLFGVI
jgi:hypothetical protein